LAFLVAPSRLASSVSIPPIKPGLIVEWVYEESRTDAIFGRVFIYH
jgi:hypothetical protein